VVPFVRQFPIGNAGISLPLWRGRVRVGVIMREIEGLPFLFPLTPPLSR